MPVSQISPGALFLSSTVAIAAALAIKYPDRALFDEHRENIAHLKGVPLLGNLLEVAKNKHRYFEYVVDLYEQLDTLTL